MDIHLLKSINFDFKSYLYRYEILGGTQLHDIYGIPRFFYFFKLLPAHKWHAITLLNTYVIFYQVMLGYFGQKSVCLLRQLFFGKEIESCLDNVFISLIFSFMPFLGLRILHGHVNIELISIPIVITVLLGFQYYKFSVVDLFLSLVCIFIMLPPIGQMGIYVPVFAFLIYLGLSIEIFKRGDKRSLFKSLIFLLFVYIGSLLTSLPEVLERYNFVNSSDSVRNLSGSNLVYSYTTHTIKDLIASFSFMLEPIMTRSNSFLLHETNYPVGLLFFFIFFLPLRKFKFLFISFFLVTVIIFGFSMNLYPIQDFLLRTIPILRNFRVPARSIMIFLMFTMMFYLSYLSNFSFSENVRSELKKLRSIYKILIFSIFLYLIFASPLTREILFCIFLLIFVWSIFSPASLSFNFNFLAIPLILMVMISAFSERYISDSISIDEFDHSRKIGDEIKLKYPFLDSPLSRVSAFGSVGNFGSNFPILLGLSSIDGYRLMHKKFLYTLDALRGRPEVNTQLTMVYRFNEKNYSIVENMFNITALLKVEDGTKKINLLKKERENNPAWFVSSVLGGNDIQDMIKEGKVNFFSKAYLLNDVKNSLIGDYSSCRHARINKITSGFNNQEVKISITSISEKCPLVVSTNFTEKLAPYDLKTGKKLDKFIAWGTLLGVIVNPGVTEIILKPNTTYPTYAAYFEYLGWFMLLMIIAYTLMTTYPTSSRLRPE